MNSKVLGLKLKNGRINNFDFLRFIAASLVVFSHSFPLSYSRNTLVEPLSWFSNNQVSFGGVAVAVFFIISGFLIAMSYENTASKADFLLKRSLRIFPGLLVVVALSCFVFGPLLTTFGFKDYFISLSTYSYLLNVLLIEMQWGLPGVFINNPYPVTVNGSLWTLYYEFLCYLVVLFLGMLGLLTVRIVSSSLIFCFFAVFIDWASLPVLWRIKDYFLFFHGLKDYFIFFGFFLSGTLFYLCRYKIKLNYSLALIAFLVVMLSLGFGWYNLAMASAGAYLIMYIAFSDWLPVSGFSKYGDFSYGIYIYAYPVQQSVTYMFGQNIDWLMNAIISYPVILIFSVLSWYFVEKPALAKRKIAFQLYLTYSTIFKHRFVKN